MKRQIFLGAMALFLFAGSLFANQPAYKPGDLLVRFANVGAQPPNTLTKVSLVNSALQATGSRVKMEYKAVQGLALIQLPAGVSVESAVASLSKSSSVLYAVPNYKLELCAVPNDTMFGELWGLNNTGQNGGKIDADIDAVEAWNISTGSKSIIVAVTDSGVDYNHPDLSANMWHNPGEIPNNGIDDDGDGYIDDYYGADTGDNDGSPADDSTGGGHGTHVAGIVGAVGNNGVGVSGVNWNVSIMAVKIMDANGAIFTSAAINGIQYATSKGAKVINASWGGSVFVQPLYDAVAAARDAGIIFVAAAGNANNNNDASAFYPANFNLANIISVMATGNTDERASYSNYGRLTVDIGAPGGDGISTSGLILSTYPNNSYVYMAGTSMASPSVAGACALLLSIDPTLKYSDIKQILMNTSDKILPGLCVSGGRMNLYAAAKEASQDTIAPSPNPADWTMKPVATGLHTISMEAMAATDRSGVQYYFECITDPTVNSGWINDPNCNLTDPAETKIKRGQTYGFHFKARDKSPQQNETDWSSVQYATTASSVDNLPPAPNATQWLVKPILQKTGSVHMKAKGSDERGAWFYFECRDKADPTVVFQSSGWNQNNSWATNPLALNHTYSFTCKVSDLPNGAGNTTNPTSPEATVTVAYGTRVLSVPVPYPSINSAIQASNDGDTVVVSPGIYYEINIPFRGQAITVRSLDPENPSIVATTIVECNVPIPMEAVNWKKRGFVFNLGEGSDSILSGITIRDGYVEGSQPWFLANEDPTVKDGNDGNDGWAGAGGGILIGYEPNLPRNAQPQASSPTIRNCVLINCVARGGAGQAGRDGNDGLNYDAGTPADPNDANVIEVPPTEATSGQDGGKGGDSGYAFGGGIYVSPFSAPLIENCSIISCYVRPGDANNAGNGGNGGTTQGGGQLPGGNGGNGGWVRPVRGGGIYVDANGTTETAKIVGCTIQDCNAIYDANIVIVGTYGTGGTVGGGRGAMGHAFGSNFEGAFGGGAYYVMGAGEAIISSTTFRNNWSSVGGGGVSYQGHIYGEAVQPLTFVDCNFIGNHADIKGGAVNSSYHTEYWIGDGSYFYDSMTSDINIINSYFEDNNANEGGAVYLDGPDQQYFFPTTNVASFLNIEGSTFVRNRAREGAAINGSFNAVTMKNCSIFDNTATAPSGQSLGGGIAFWNTWGKIIDCSIQGNSSEAFGGGAWISGMTDDATQSVNFQNCLITDNTTGFEGGGVACDTSGYAYLQSCTLVNNSATDLMIGAGGGVSSSKNLALVSLENSILWHNTATYGPQMAVGSVFGSPVDIPGPYAEIDVTYSDVEGGPWQAFVEDPAFTDIWWNPGNIDADPVFVQTDINDTTYFLSHIAAGQNVDSPCIDTGSVNVDNSRYIYNRRVSEPNTTRSDFVSDTGIVDIGYHYIGGGTSIQLQYQLQIEVADTGFGTNGRLNAKGFGDYPFNINDPNTIMVNQGAVAGLTATPDPGFQVRYWIGTDDDSSTDVINTVSMNANKKVVVAFEPFDKFYLTVNVIGNGTVTPFGTEPHFPGEIVNLTAVLGNPSDAIIWSGTDDDTLSTGHNTVTMTGHKTVTVRFYTPRILYVGSDTNYPSLQAAIDDANERDIVQLMPSSQPYYTQWGYQIIGKNITITSVNPYDPAVVASTIIQLANGPDGNIKWGFTFANVGPLMKLQGLTIRGFSGTGSRGHDGDPQNGYYDGVPGSTVPGLGIYCASNASPTITNCVIDDCHTYGGDGGNGAGGATGHPNGGNGGWPGAAWGGAIACSDNSNPAFINCTFSNNSAIGGNAGDGGSGGTNPNGYGGRGGGWYYGYQIPSPWEFIPPYPNDKPKNYSGLGGAVYISSGCNPAFVSCNFVNNTSGGGLNGICGQTPPLNSRDEPTIRYKIDNLGGAVYLASGASALFRTCTFTGNTADTNKVPASNDAFVGFGGAVAYEDGATPIFEDCTISNNTADIGGGMYVTRSEPVIKNTNFIQNTATHGGGLLITDGDAQIKGCLFRNNQVNASGSEGAAIGLFGSDAEITDCVITDNNSAGYGAGIYTTSKLVNDGNSSVNTSVIIKNCLITNNTSVLGGSGITAQWYSDPNIVNCTITGNRSPAGIGGGIYSSFNNYTRIVNSIIWGNSAVTGHEIAIGVQSLPSTVDVFFSDVNKAADSNYVDIGCTLHFDSNSFSSDPCFVSAGDYHLNQTAAGQTRTSNCVDSGSDFASRFGLHKYTTRTDEFPDLGIVDLGYHYSLPTDCGAVNYVEDDTINFNDFVEIANYWLSENCSPANEWCSGRDITFDGTIDVLDLKDFTMCWLYVFGQGGVIPGDTVAPTPNPMTFQVLPHVTVSFTVSMTATTAVDNNPGQVQYMFEERTGNIGGTSSGWQNSTVYTDSGLQANTPYTYRVRARDISGNMTDWSAESTINNVGDVNAPTPAPTIILVAGIGSTIPDDNTSSAQFSWPFGSEWWNKIIVNVTGITDDSNTPMDVRFYCTDDSSLNSENKVRDPNGAVHRINLGQVTDSLGSELAGYRVTYTGSAGNPSISGAFIVYDVDTGQFGGLGSTRHWKARVYDASGNFAESTTVAIGP